MATIGIKSIVKYLIYFSILATPLYGLGEFIGYMGLIEYNRKEVLTPFFVKVLKDFMFITASVLSIVIHRTLNFYSLVVLMFFIYITMLNMLNMLSVESLILILAGIRSFLPLLFAIFIRKLVDLEFFKKIINLFLIVYIVSAIFAIVQFLFGKNHLYGLLFDKYFFRVVSFFVQPSSFGIFISIFTYFYFFLSPASNFTKIVVLILSGILILLTGSGISISLYCFIVFYVFLIKSKDIINRFIITYLSLPFIITMLLNLDKFTFREDIYVSGLERLEILFDFFQSSSITQIFLGKGLGIGTNTLYTAFPDIADEYGQIPDSLYISLLYQTGIIGLAVFLLLNVLIFIRLLKNNINMAVGLLLIGLSGLTSNVLEFWPINLIYALLLSIALGKGLRLEQNALAKKPK